MKKAHIEACKMERDISNETEHSLCKSLNAPARCPHGSYISSCTMLVGTCDECDGITNLRKQRTNEVPLQK